MYTLRVPSCALLSDSFYRGDSWMKKTSKEGIEEAQRWREVDYERPYRMFYAQDETAISADTAGVRVRSTSATVEGPWQMVYLLVGLANSILSVHRGAHKCMGYRKLDAPTRNRNNLSTEDRERGRKILSPGPPFFLFETSLSVHKDFPS